MKINKETQELITSKNLLIPELMVGKTNQEVIKTWLRHEKNLHVDIYLGSKSWKWEINTWIIDLKHQKKIKWTRPVKIYDTYEDALEVCLQEMIKLL